MVFNNAPSDNVTYIPLCIQCIDMVNNLHIIFYSRDDIMCPNEIDISMQYKFGLDYVHDSPNKLTRCVQKIDRNPIE